MSHFIAGWEAALAANGLAATVSPEPEPGRPRLPLRTYLHQWAEENIEDVRNLGHGPHDTIWVWSDGSFAIGGDLRGEYGGHVATHGEPVGVAPWRAYREPLRLAEALLRGAREAGIAIAS
jgi:hypothetical protein